MVGPKSKNKSLALRSASPTMPSNDGIQLVDAWIDTETLESLAVVIHKLGDLVVLSLVVLCVVRENGSPSLAT